MWAVVAGCTLTLRLIPIRVPHPIEDAMLFGLVLIFSLFAIIDAVCAR